MDWFYIFTIAFVLSIDSFAVSITTGGADIKIRFWQATRIAIIFAIFQGLFPVLGWFAGKELEQLISQFDHWISFSLLTLLGLKMILDAFKTSDNEIKYHRLNTKYLIGLAIATSIDALIIGVSFAFMKINIIYSAIIIGAVTFIASMLGILFGKKLGFFFGKKMDLIGGIILIALGIKILFSHI